MLRISPVLALSLFIVPATAANYYHYGSADRGLPGVYSGSNSQGGARADNSSAFVAIRDKYRVTKVTTDSVGNSYAAGARQFADGSTDVLVAKLDRTGNTLLVITISAEGREFTTATMAATDLGGNIYVGGSTNSAGFPLLGALQTQVYPGSYTGFVAKFSPDGNQLIYSTYFGGTAGNSSVSAVIADDAGNAYIGGWTESRDYPRTPGLPVGPVYAGLPATYGGFFAKLSPKGDSILYSGVFSGTRHANNCFHCDYVTGVSALVLDLDGNLYCAGYSNVQDLPTTPNSFLNQGYGPFVAEISKVGTSVTALTYLSNSVDPVGGSPSTLSAIAIGVTGDIYVAGTTSDASFPVTQGALRTVLTGAPNQVPPFGLIPDAFVARIKGDLTTLIWATYLGDSQSETATGIAVDTSGTAWVTGTTSSPAFPNTNGWHNGGDFLVGLNATGSALTYSARFPSSSMSSSIAIDPTGAIHTAHATGLISVINPAATQADVFVVQNAAGPGGNRIAPGELISIYGSDIGPQQSATAVANAAGFLPTSIAGVQVTVNDAQVPLLYVSQNQINAVAPLGLSGQTAVIRVASGNTATKSFAMAVAAQAPGIFRIDETHAVALNQDGSINSKANPALAGSVIAIWVTGVNALDPSLKDGQIQTGALRTNCCSASVGPPTEVLYSGNAPGTVVGVSQVNVRIPPYSEEREVAVTVISGNEQDESTIYIKPAQ